MMYRNGNVSVSVFTNVSKDGNYTFVKYVPAVSYKDKDGNWKKTDSFSLEDLTRLKTIIERILVESVNVYTPEETPTE